MSFGANLIDSVVTRMVVPFVGPAGNLPGVSIRGRFFGESTTGVMNVKKIKGMNFMLMNWNGILEISD